MSCHDGVVERILLPDVDPKYAFWQRNLCHVTPLTVQKQHAEESAFFALHGQSNAFIKQ